MKTVKIELTTWLCYSDETDILEVELEDEVADKLLAVADGKELNEDSIEELVPEAFEPLDLEAYQRAFDRQVIDGWECCTEDACSKDLREIYEDSSRVIISNGLKHRERRSPKWIFLNRQISFRKNSASSAR